MSAVVTVGQGSVNDAAEDAVRRACGLMDPIGLPEVLDLAGLQTRVDRKYFVPADTFRAFAAAQAARLRVLEVDARRMFGYESVYFDTPQLSCYRAHLQRRRRRFKARTRTYTDSGLCLFEVKLAGHRGHTCKRRIPHPAALRDRLTGGALAHLAATLHDCYGQPVPGWLHATLATTYRRATFVCPVEGTRLTCDVALCCHNGHALVRDAGTHVLVECKSAAPDSAADRHLRELGIRPVSVSKYCVGVAALHPGLPSNPWHRILRRHFRQPAPTAV